MKQFFSLILFSLFLIATPMHVVFATCTCTTSGNDCQQAFLPIGNQNEQACKETCKKNLADKFGSSAYAEDTAGDVLNQQCNQIHKTYTSNLAGASSGPTSKTAKTAGLTPTLNVEIPGLKFSDPIVTAETVKTSFLADYLNAIYTYLIGAAVILAIVMIMIGGLQYTLGASSQNAGKGKDRIKNAVTGLVLLLCVFLILKTTNPQLVIQKMVELQNIQEVEFEDNPVDNGSTEKMDPNAKTGPPSTKGDGAVITRLIGAFPSSMTKCSKEAANYTADALTKKHICVGPLHCAYTVSNFLEYIGCTNRYNGNASWIPAMLDNDGWVAETIRSSKQFKSLPFGMLVMSGHVGISLGDGYYFDSGSNVPAINKATGGDCISNNVLSRKSSGCDYCSLIPEEAPRTARNTKDSESANQGWLKVNGMVSRDGGHGFYIPADPSRDTWQIILVPPSEASKIKPSPKIPCTITAGGLQPRTVTISKNLCTLIQLKKSEWKLLKQAGTQP